MLQGVDRVLFRVPSLDAAVTYYRDTLKMKLLRRERSTAAFALGEGSSGSGGGAELILHDSPDLPAQAVYFRVASVDEVHDQRDALRLKFSTPPRAVSKGKSATVRDPFGNVLLLLDRTKEAQAGNVIESVAPAGGNLFAGVEPRISPKRDALVAAYEKIARTADDLPYTHHFESLYAQYLTHFTPPLPSRQEVWRHLLNTRKGGKLPKLGEARSIPPEATDAERNLLKALLGEEIGRRDRLPYTKPFDELVEAFNKATRRNLTPHQIWRLVATLAK